MQTVSFMFQVVRGVLVPILPMTALATWRKTAAFEEVLKLHLPLNNHGRDHSYLVQFDNSITSEVVMTTGNATEENVIKASEFKAKCLKLMDAVADTGEELVITKNGNPVAKLVPYTKPQSLYGMFKDDIQILGDIMAPIAVEWDAMKDDNEEDYY